MDILFGSVATVLVMLLKAYFWVVLIACIISFVQPDPYNPFVRTLRALTEPVFYRIRKWLPFTYAGGLDFSPVVVLLAIELLEQIIVRTAARF